MLFAPRLLRLKTDFNMPIFAFRSCAALLLSEDDDFLIADDVRLLPHIRIANRHALIPQYYRSDYSNALRVGHRVDTLPLFTKIRDYFGARSRRTPTRDSISGLRVFLMIYIASLFSLYDTAPPL